MKKRTVPPTSMFVLVLCLVSGCPMLKAQNTVAVNGQNEPVFSGSRLKSEDAAMKADAVFIGQVMAIGPANLKAPGQSAYHGVQVKVLQVLRGSVGAQVSVTLYATYLGREQPPQVGNTYIFFAHKNTAPGWDNYTALKLLPATATTTTKVRGVIEKAPK